MKPATQTCPSLAIVQKLPARVDSALLCRHRRADEPLVVVKLVGVGNAAPYDFHDKGTRSYIFRHESQQEGHILRVPLHLWQAGGGRLAHELMDQRRLPHAIVVLLEPAPPATAAAQTPPRQTGATDTSTHTRNVVGPGAEPTVAPTPGGTCGAPGESAPPAAGAATQQPGTQPREAGAACPQAADVKAPEAVSSTASVAATSVQALPPSLIVGTPLHAAAYALAEPPKRLKALAALLGVAEQALRQALTHADSRVELAGGGWVRRTA
ncbi:hypothetical protein [Prosthecobacter fluviatilis]|uniref:Uncharacterized protein n=1 Tax=Prosthecobacter fluviatilis TaxID=445931 RepID=A0ABW0KVC2_9BACT